MADSNKVGATNAGGGDPRSALRRRDRGKDDTWVVAFLKRVSYGFAEKVAFSAVAMGRLLPAPEALEFSVEYAGVVAFGTGHIVEDREEARTALRMLLDKYAPHLTPGVDYRPTTDGELKRTAVYRIDVETWSGKQKEVTEDFPGAFSLDLPPVPFPTRGATSD